MITENQKTEYSLGFYQGQYRYNHNLSPKYAFVNKSDSYVAGFVDGFSPTPKKNERYN